MSPSETQASKIGDAVKTLRIAGTPSIFVMPQKGFAPKQKDAAAPSNPHTRRQIIAHLDAENSALDCARRDLHEAARLDHALPAAAEWILDNAYLIRTQIAEVRRHLPRDFEAWKSSAVGAGSLLTVTRVFASESDFAINDDNLRDFLRRHQVSAPLTIAELWAFPLFLRVALIEAVTAIAVRVAGTQQLREAAYLWANRLASAARVGEEIFARCLDLLESEPVALEPSFAAALAEQLQDEEQALGPIQRWIEQHFQALPITDLARDLHTREAAQTASPSRTHSEVYGFLPDFPLPKFLKTSAWWRLSSARIPRASILEAISRRATDAKSATVERSRARLRPQRVGCCARAAIRLTRQNGENATYYLTAEGMPLLEKETQARVPLFTRAGRVAHSACRFALRSASIISLSALFHCDGRHSCGGSWHEL